MKLWIYLILLMPSLAFAGNWGEDWGTMTWGAPLVIPSTPQITKIDYGNEEIYLTVSDSGSSTISSYTATCTDGTRPYTGTSTTSRVTVSGLTNGVGYSCSVTATNAAGTSTSSATSPPIVPEYIPTGLPIWLLYVAREGNTERSFPYMDNIDFWRQQTGDVIALSDNSLWYITGRHSSDQDVLRSHDITIYNNGEDFTEPNGGVRSDYYMYISGSSVGFYVEPIMGLSIRARDSLEFQREKTNSLVALSDATLWDIKGTHSNCCDVLGMHELTVYTGPLPPLNTSGDETDFYMYISGSSVGFYIEPLNNVMVMVQGSAVFSREQPGDNIALSDGSIWHLKGAHSAEYDVLHSHDLVIYSNVDSIRDPDIGERTSHYMYIKGSSRGFFVDRI